MNEENSQDQSLMDKLLETTEKHYEDDKFGVSELAREMGISRSQLHRRLQTITNKSASQIIREFRLGKAKEMLEKDLANVSEIAYRVGFGSPSYFITCFRDFYGYSPGETKKMIDETSERSTKKINKKLVYSALSVLVLLIVLSIVFLPQLNKSNKDELERSIAVLPFKNSSAEAENQYFVNGMMEDIRNNLALIGELRVISKTSTEKYRNTGLSSKEIAQELNVKYLLEGTVQKQGNQVKIHAQLIEAETDDHIWVNTFTEEINDVFKMQSQIAESIADELHATITPEEKQRIEKPPTDNPEAYDLYLRASDYYYEGVSGMKIAVQYLNQAIELDPDFALAYTVLGLIYHQLVWGESYFEKSFGDTILYFANKALKIDPELSKGYSLLAYYHREKGNYEDGIIHAKKAIELDPNNGSAYQVLSVIYNFKEQYIEALKNAKKAQEIFIGDLNYYKDILSLVGGIYMSIYDNEKAASTFKEIEKLDPLYGNHRLSWLYITSGNWEAYKILVDEGCALDSGAECLDALSGYYFWTENYELAWDYHQKWKQAKLANKENFYEKGDKMGYMHYGIGKKEEALKYFEDHIDDCNEAIRLGRWWGKEVAPVDLTGMYAFLGEKDKAMQYLYNFGDNIGYNGNLRWIQNAPMFKNLWEEEEFKTFVERYENRYAAIRAEVDRLEKLGEI